MADKIVMEFIPYTDIKNQYPYWNRFPLMKELYTKGRNPDLIHLDVILDTSTATNLTETGAPTNEVINFTVPEQIYLRSDDAGDISKKIDVIGQKADDSWGTFTLTSDASDGTTPVDCGTWKFIAMVNKNDAWAGNAIIDDDGTSTTVYWTAALGATATTGIYVVPEGYCASCIDGSFKSLVEITTVNGMNFAIDHVMGGILNLYNPTIRQHNPYIQCTEGKTNIRSSYYTAAFNSKAHMLIAVWKKPSNV